MANNAKNGSCFNLHRACVEACSVADRAIRQWCASKHWGGTLNMTSIKRAVLAATVGLATLGGSGGFAPEARAGFIVTMVQSGTDVVATGAGTIDLAGLSLFTTANTTSGIIPGSGAISLGSPSSASTSVYSGAISGPTNIGAGGQINASSGSGDRVALAPLQFVYVPVGYVSGGALSNTTTWSNHTFATLGVVPGTYMWTWGSGANADSFTLNIGAASVPEPGMVSLVVLAFALSWLAAARRVPDRD
jgi:hypothetical protein